MKLEIEKVKREIAELQNSYDKQCLQYAEGLDDNSLSKIENISNEIQKKEQLLKHLGRALEFSMGKEKESNLLEHIRELENQSFFIEGILAKRSNAAQKLSDSIKAAGEAYESLSASRSEAIKALAPFGNSTVSCVLDLLGNMRDTNSRLGALMVLAGLKDVMHYRETRQVAVMKNLKLDDLILENNNDILNRLQNQINQLKEANNEQQK